MGSDNSGSRAVTPSGIMKYLDDHLSDEQDECEFPVTRSCPLCGGDSRMDASLVTMSCGLHTLPICQWSLSPVFLERHLQCNFCGRLTIIDSDAHSTLAGVCA